MRRALGGLHSRYARLGRMSRGGSDPRLTVRGTRV
jgi:hypothetical protein